MQDSRNSNEHMNDLLRSLQSVTALMNNLLSDIKDHSGSLALVKAKLESLTETVDELSSDFRDGNGKGSIMTRLALAEKSLEDLEEELGDLEKELSASVKEIRKHVDLISKTEKQNEQEEAKYIRQKSIQKWQLIGSLIIGALAMASSIIQYFLK